MMPRLFLIKITCLGQCWHEVRAERGSADAIVHALDRYPRACVVSARPLGARA